MRRETWHYNTLGCSPCNQFICWLESMRFTRRVPWLSNEVSTVIAQCVGMTQFIAWLCPGPLHQHSSVTGRSALPTITTLHLPSPATPLHSNIPTLTILWINHRLNTLILWLLNLRQKLQWSSNYVLPSTLVETSWPFKKYQCCWLGRLENY